MKTSSPSCRGSAELFVIARNSSFHYKGQAVDIRRWSRAWRAIRAGRQHSPRPRPLRITAQLVDAVTGAHRWAERYDRDVKDIFAVQEEVARTVAPLLAVHVGKAETERTLLKPPTSWQAHDYYMRASVLWIPTTHRSTEKTCVKPRRLLQQALAIDPNYARAHAALSMIYVSSGSIDGTTIVRGPRRSIAPTVQPARPCSKPRTCPRRMLGLAGRCFGCANTKQPLPRSSVPAC